MKKQYFEIGSSVLSNKIPAIIHTGVIPRLDRGIQSFSEVLDCPVEPDNDKLLTGHCTGKKKARISGMALLITLYTLLLTGFGYAVISDRVVAYVDDQAITLSEFNLQYEKTRVVSPDIKREEVLNTMINRALLLREARKYRIEARSREEMIQEFIDLKIRSFIRVSEAETEDFYRQNSARFEGKDFEGVRDEIENYLTELRLNERLKETLAGLRQSADIKIQLNDAK